LGRLLELNHARYAKEVKAGLHRKKGVRRKGGGSKGKSSPGGKGGALGGRQESLPGMEDDSPQQLGMFGEEE